MARFSYAKGGSYERFMQMFRQLKKGMATIGVFSVGQAVALTVGFECLAGGAPEFFGTLNGVAGSNFPLGIVKQLTGQAGMFFYGGFPVRHA